MAAQLSARGRSMHRECNHAQGRLWAALYCKCVNDLLHNCALVWIKSVKNRFSSTPVRTLHTVCVFSCDLVILVVRF